MSSGKNSDELAKLARDRELLLRRIEESGVSARKFAIEVLRREERTIRRYISGESPIPNLVRDFLRDPKPAPWP